MPDESSSAKNPLGDPALRKSLADFVRRRVPSSDADDVVQIVLLDALDAAGRPEDPRELQRWLFGIARHKVADYHRRVHREPPTELPDLEAGPEPIEARELARWAEEQVGGARDAKETLRWMAREGEGEKLESIAAEEQVPAARVRQRVSRMRRWMKERWLAELAAVAALSILAIIAWWLLRDPAKPEEARPDEPLPSAPIRPESPSPLEQARVLREDGLRRCERADWRGCLESLDRARGLDPEGDADPKIGAARVQAEKALKDEAPSPSSTAAPSSIAPDAPLPKNDEKKLDAPSTPTGASTAAPPPAKKKETTFKGKPTPGAEKKAAPVGKTGKPSGLSDFGDSKK